MAFISLSSLNPKLSWILQKNPQTQLDSKLALKRKTKSSNTYLWFENLKEDLTFSHVSLFSYNFQNNTKKASFDYLDYSGYSEGDSYLQLINEQLRTAFNTQHQDDTYNCTLEFNVHNHNELDYSVVFKDIVTTCDTKYKHSHIILTAKSVYEALNIAAIICFSSILHNPDMYIQEEQFKKYLTILTKYTNNYRILRDFVSFIKSEKLFKECKKVLDSTKFDFSITNAFDSRKKFIFNVLEKTNKSPILYDLGCGSGQYFKQHLKLYPEVIGIEQDEESYIDATHSIRKINAEDKIQVLNQSIEDYFELADSSFFENTDILLTEVLEHIEYENSIKMLEKILNFNPNLVIVTLPNNAFNKHFGFEKLEDSSYPYRHWDHKWEPNNKGLIISLLNTIWSNPNYNATIYSIGDKLQNNPNESITFGIVFKRIKEL